MDAELDIDIDDPNQLLTLLKSKLDLDDTRTVTSLIQNIVVGTALIDKETRSYMLSMIGKAVMYIVLDQNGITNFTDAFKYSVDQIISGLQEIDQLREENIQLTAICDYQEKQLMGRSAGTEKTDPKSEETVNKIENSINKEEIDVDQKLPSSRSGAVDLSGVITIEKLESHKKVSFLSV